MEAAASAESPVAVDRVLVIRLNEAPDAGKKSGEGKHSLLEWTKAVLLPLVTVLISIAGGFYLKNREAREAETSRELAARESNDHMFAQILTQREQSDAQIRMDMFKTVITNFFAGAKNGDWSDKVLQLELLASNFNQSLDLAPLFKDLARRLASDAGLTEKQRTELRKRLYSTASDVIFKQVHTLSRRGFTKFAPFALGEWEKQFGKPLIDETIDRSRLAPSTPLSPALAGKKVRFAVEVVDVSFERREIEIRLRVEYGGTGGEDIDRHFWVGQFDFPMLDNTQLPDGMRASVVLTDIFIPDAERDREAGSWAQFHLVVFPTASASFKERQDYDDILADKLNSEAKQTAPVSAEP